MVPRRQRQRGPSQTWAIAGGAATVAAVAVAVTLVVQPHAAPSLVQAAEPAAATTPTG